MPGFVIALITAVHIAVCIGLMASILLQSGKGGGLAGTFGAGSSQTLFGGRGAASFPSRSHSAAA
jgi:preprotein translocase subunit SecG